MAKRPCILLGAWVVKSHVYTTVHIIQVSESFKVWCGGEGEGVGGGGGVKRGSI